MQSSQNTTTTEMCDAVTKDRFNREQFIKKTSISFGLADFKDSALDSNKLLAVLHTRDCRAEGCFCSLICTFITSDTSITWCPNHAW